MDRESSEWLRALSAGGAEQDAAEARWAGDCDGEGAQSEEPGVPAGDGKRVMTVLLAGRPPCAAGRGEPQGDGRAAVERW